MSEKTKEILRKINSLTYAEAQELYYRLHNSNEGLRCLEVVSGNKY